MRYLFGDSTPFPLGHNFLETLAAVTETCVALLHLDADAAVVRRASRRRRAATEDELARLDLLRDRVEDELAGALASDTNDAIGTVAAKLANELERAYAAARREIASRAPSPTIAEDAAPLRLLERLLIAHELPDTEWELMWRTACGDDPPHAVACGVIACGLDVRMAIRIPDDHVLGEPLRLGQLVSRSFDAVLDGAHLRDYFLTRIDSGADGGALRLQETPHPDARGFDIELPADPAATPAVHCVGHRVRLLIPPDRAPDFASVWERVAAALASLRAHRRSLTDASLEGVPIAHLERPQRLAEALIAGVGPLASELCARSKVPGEITLKRERGDGRRDELFVPQAELLAKLRSLSPEQRALFGGYGLEGASDLITAQVRRLDLPLRATPNGDG